MPGALRIAAAVILISSVASWSVGSDLYSQAVQAFQRGHFSEVLDLLSRLPTVEAERVASQNLTALALCELRRYDEALVVGRRVCQADPSNPNYVYNLGLIYIAKKDFVEAEKLFRDALVRSPNSSKLNEGLGESLFHLYDLPEARKCFRRALEIEPLNVSAQVALARLFYKTGDKEQFDLAVSRAIQLDPKNYQACYYYGLLLTEYRGDKVSAAKYFEKSIQLYPGFSEALLALGKILAAQEHWDQACDLYERALMTDSQNPQLYFLASTAYRKLGKKDKAEWALKQFQALEARSKSSE